MRRPRATSPTRRAGFILLFGVRPFSSAEPGPTVPARCPSCQSEVALVPTGYRNWFTLFFIPVFPVSARQRYWECPNCGAQFPGAAEDLRQELATIEQQPPRPTPGT